MRDVPTTIIDALSSGDFTGNARPIARVTVQHPMMRLHQYGGDRNAPDFSSPTGTPVRFPRTTDPALEIYANFLFGDAEKPLELPNIKTVSWNRSSGAGIADCTIEMWNTEPLPLDAKPVWAWNGVPDLDQPGYFTFNRGKSQFSPRWGHLPNEFANMLMPDNLIRVFEGYGTNWGMAPEADPHLVQTGVWIIDDVIPSANGTLVIRLRDTGRLLADHLAWLPVVPRDFYPLEFKMVEKLSGYFEGQTIITKVTVGPNGEYTITKPTPPKPLPGQPPVHTKTRIPLKAHACSNDVWGQRNIYGHTLGMAFDSSTASWWVSVGNVAATKRYAYEWVEASAGNKTISEVSFIPQKSGYTAYLSIWSDGKWHRLKKTGGHINYHRDGIGKNGADIDYVMKLVCNKGQTRYTFKLPQAMKASKIRITLSNLQDFNLGTYQYRAGVRDVRAFGYATSSKPPPTKAQVAAYNAAEKAYLAALAKYTDQKDKISDIVSPFVRGIQDDFERKDVNKITVTQTRDKWISRGTYGIRATNGKPLKTDGYAVTGCWAELDYRHQQVDVRFTPEKDTTAILRVSDKGGLGMIRVRFHASTLDVKVIGDGVQIATFTATLPRSIQDLGWGRITIEDKKLTVYLRDAETAVPIPTQLPLDRHFEQVFTVTDDSFNHISMGTGAGFDHIVEHVRAWGILKGGIFDSFSRLNDIALRQAESGHAWREAAIRDDIGMSIDDQRAHRHGPNNGMEVYAVAKLSTIAQTNVEDLSGDPANAQSVFSRFQRAGTGVQYWLLRYSNAGNHIAVRCTTATHIDVVSLRNGTETVVHGYDHASLGSGSLQATLIENRLQVWLGTDTDMDGSNPLVIDVTDDALQHDLLGTYAGMGADDNALYFDNFNAIDPTTTGGGPGTTDDPTTTVIEYEVYIPPHWEPGAGAKPGVYEDYTDLVKLFCCWAGLYWPRDAFQVYSDNTIRANLGPAENDWVLGREAVGRAWGDFENTGTAGPTPLGTGIWDKRSLMDCIAYVRDICGFLFAIDETGAVQWRLPNYYTKGNYVATFSGNPRRTSDMITLDETTNLLDLGATLTSRNVRERVFVTDNLAKYGGMAAGFNPNPVGLRRVGGWTDQHFASDDECRLMADMITIRQMFTYRTDQVTIPADPRIQVDDQVQLYERVTAEGYVHYVDGVSSTLDMTTGQWSYGLTLYWLGDDPFKHWAVDWTQLNAETQDYLALMRFEADNYHPPARPDTGATQHIEAPKITSAATLGGTITQTVYMTITSTGSPVTKLSTSALPPGLTFADLHDGTGILSGTPTVAAVSTVTVKATNGISPDATQALTITINSGIAPTFLSADTVTFPRNTPAHFTVIAAGLPAPALTLKGTLPAGLHFTDNHDGTATIAGTPTTVTSTRSVLVTAKNIADSVVQTLKVNVTA